MPASETGHEVEQRTPRRPTPAEWEAAALGIGSNGHTPLAPTTPVDSINEDDLTRLEVVSGDTIQERAVEWVWPNRIPRGHISLIAGDPGLGKSKVLLDMACRRSQDGKRWPDGPCAPPHGTILFFTAEDNLADTVKPRILAMGGNPSRFKFVQMVRHGIEDEVGIEFSLAEHLLLLEVEIMRHGATDVFIDPITAYLGKADSHKDAELRSILGPLSRMAERRNVAIVGVMHLNKKEQAQALYRVGGSVAFTAAPRSVFLIKADPGMPETRRFFIHAKTNLSDYAPTLAFTHTGQTIRWEASPVADVTVHTLSRTEGADSSPEREEAKAFLLQALAHGPQKASVVKQWAKDTGIAERTLNRAKTDLRVLSIHQNHVAGPDGQFQPQSYWEWRLPPAGTSSHEEANEGSSE